MCHCLIKHQVAGIDNSVGRKWGGGRAMMLFHRVAAVVVVLCGAAAAIAYCVDAEIIINLARVLDEAAAACDSTGNDTVTSRALFKTAFDTHFSAAYAAENYLEFIALLLICFDYFFVVALSVALFRQAERAGSHVLSELPAAERLISHATRAMAALVDDAVQASVLQRRRMALACGTVLATFPLRASYAIMNALSIGSSPNPACGACDSCQSTAWLVRRWLDITPEFEPVVVALSSPLPLVLSLWLITAARRRALEIAVGIRGIAAQDLQP